MTLENLINRRFGRLAIIGRAENSKARQPRWHAKCDCGNEAVVWHYNLVRNRAKSCGCLQRELAAKRGASTRTHGQSHGRERTSEYRIWSNIKTRCTNSKVPAFKYYGGRGIAICERWQSFENFFTDMGPRPSPKHSIDRYPDKNGNYEPGNCRWATIVEQARNTRANRTIDYDGRQINFAEACELAGVKYSAAHFRLQHGLPFDKPRRQPRRSP